MSEHQTQLEGGAYEVIQGRLQNNKSELVQRLQQLDDERQKVFGTKPLQLIANERISTPNNCIARDIIAFDELCIFGYNVHFGLRTDIQLDDVFSIYKFQNNRFAEADLDFIQQPEFESDFKNLYKYYRNTTFSKFAVIGNYLHMVFQIGEKPSDIKSFKWLIQDGQLQYIDNRSDHEFKFPNQHQFNWQEVGRDEHRYGTHSHVSILDQVFVETIGGDLTIKIEDNTDSGTGILSEPVEHPDQTLDDGQYRYAKIDAHILIEITPFQESARYFVFNTKLKSVNRVDSLAQSAILLPSNQGIIFPSGYFLNTGEYNLFETYHKGLQFEQAITSANGEDVLYQYYAPADGLYVLMPYNSINQKMSTPIQCNGYGLTEDGTLYYFKAEDEQVKHHIIQIWETPFYKQEQQSTEYADHYFTKVGNKDLVRATAECAALIKLLNKEDTYANLYYDIVTLSKDILDSYFWVNEAAAFNIAEPIQLIYETANAAIDEFDKVVELKSIATKRLEQVTQQSESLIQSAKNTSGKNIQFFVDLLSNFRSLSGEIINEKETRYIDLNQIEQLENDLQACKDRVAEDCVRFLLKEDALQDFATQIDSFKSELEKPQKVATLNELAQKIDQTGANLEMLIDIVNNLKIDDTTNSTQIIERISAVFVQINQIRNQLNKKRNALGEKEAKADFQAKIQLLEQSLINYMELSTTIEKCSDYETKLIVQLEEIEAKFADYDAFMPILVEQRSQIIEAFERKKAVLTEQKNKKVVSAEQSAYRIIESVTKKANQLTTASEIKGYFADDLMIDKARQIIQLLENLNEHGKAEVIASALKESQQHALRQLKDKTDLFDSNDDAIKFGGYKFGVNRQPLNATIVQKEAHLFTHLTGTSFYQKLVTKELESLKPYWNQTLKSENNNIYRSAYLAYMVTQVTSDINEIPNSVAQYCNQHLDEGYQKGIHDTDAIQIATTLVQLRSQLGLLSVHPNDRGLATLFWLQLPDNTKTDWLQQFNQRKAIVQVFPDAPVSTNLYNDIFNELSIFAETLKFNEEVNLNSSAEYLINTLTAQAKFEISARTLQLKTDFLEHLTGLNGLADFQNAIHGSVTTSTILNCLQWLKAFKLKTDANNDEWLECASFLIQPTIFSAQANSANAVLSIDQLQGMHPTIQQGNLELNFYDFELELKHYTQNEIPKLLELNQIKRDTLIQIESALDLKTFKPKVLSSFVRNKLISDIYLPLIGDNFSKQLGSVGVNAQTDRMGMLLLISPPGYGKTTLMEYIANLLGLVFVKINGPSIGHQIVSLDPNSANNAAAKKELEKLNLAFEMQNNVMLYLDDIQHCNPEFLQKFISLADGTRKIDGVFNGKAKTYDLRQQRFALVMAGNPYTEQGEKFKVPDMLANRADIYNLGDIVGGSEQLFKLSLIENALSSNPTLRQLASKNIDDFYAIVKQLEQGTELTELQGSYSTQELNDIQSVIEKVIKIREVVYMANQMYIASSAQEDAYRKVPVFKLQGSYRDMNKLIAKVVPIMNEAEINRLILTHYESEAQTLGQAAEANLLQLKAALNWLTPSEATRWDEIQAAFLEAQKLKGLGDNQENALLLDQLTKFNDHFKGIATALRALKS